MIELYQIWAMGGLSCDAEDLMGAYTKTHDVDAAAFLAAIREDSEIGEHFETYLDPDQDLRRSLTVDDVKRLEWVDVPVSRIAVVDEGYSEDDVPDLPDESCTQFVPKDYAVKRYGMDPGLSYPVTMVEWDH